MRCLMLSSLLLFFNMLLIAQPVSDKFPELSNDQKGFLTFESVKYQASIDVIGKHLSGILVFKQQEDNSIRTVFVNEMGVTFFDITFYDDSYHFNAIMESMDKKAVKISLAKDLGMILMRGIFKNEKNIGSRYIPGPSCLEKEIVLRLKRKGTVRYHAKTACNEFPLIENYGRKKVITVTQTYSAENSMPDSIFVQHHTVNFTISLKQLHVTE